ncbi:MAG TPA: DUF2817 domain-containing protein [Burkholderiales bacterium]|nr:DUF2817 domain-containing protein [Burkholderiales bacterium]
MNRPSDFFSPDFPTARAHFREAVAARNGRLDTLPLAENGPHGEDLGIDVGWFGASQPRRVLVHSSGLHGVEGYAGSAIQLQWLERGMPAPGEGDAIVLAHLLNPYGAAWLRRVNENNVDLNRNFRAGDEAEPESDGGYTALDSILNPPSPPHADWFYARAAWLVGRHGMAKLRQTIASGQRVNPRGLFYAGRTLEAGPAAYQAYLKTQLSEVSRIVAIDVHTGLGRYGRDALMVDALMGSTDAKRNMRRYFGARLQWSDGPDAAYRARGTQQEMYERSFPRATIHFATQEFGTLHAVRVLAALRAENRWHHYGDGAPDHPARQRLFDVFCPPDADWREYVLRRGAEVAAQAFALAFTPITPTA